MPVDLDELDRLEREGTPGEWTEGVSDDEDLGTVYVWPKSGSPQIVASFSRDADAELAAAARNALPELIRVARAACAWRDVPTSEDMGGRLEAALHRAVDALRGKP